MRTVLVATVAMLGIGALCLLGFAYLLIPTQMNVGVAMLGAWGVAHLIGAVGTWRGSKWGRRLAGPLGLVDVLAALGLLFLSVWALANGHGGPFGTATGVLRGEATALGSVLTLIGGFAMVRSVRVDRRGSRPDTHSAA